LVKQKRYVIDYLNRVQWSKLKNLEKNSRDDLILTVLYEAGCTVNELVHIKMIDFNFSVNTLRIGKKSARNSSERMVYISGSLISKIELFRKENPESPFLLYTRQSKSMTTKRIRQIIQKMFSSIGIEGGPQTIRYTHIVHAYKKKIPLDAIQRQVGLKRSRAIEIFSQLPELSDIAAYESFTD